MPYESTSANVIFDAYVVLSRDELVPAGVVTYRGSNSYNKLDTNSSIYSSTPDSPKDAKANVMQYAGRMLVAILNGLLTIQLIISRI